MDALIDEMYDGVDEKINGLNLKCKAYSVKKLIADDKPLKTDYSVISYTDAQKFLHWQGRVFK